MSVEEDKKRPSLEETYEGIAEKSDIKSETQRKGEMGRENTNDLETIAKPNEQRQ